MKISLLIFLLLNFSCSAFGEIIEKYYTKKAKESVEHLSNVSKNSIQGINSDMVSGDNLLTVRNIRISKTIANNVLTGRETEVLDAMEDASLILVQKKKNFTCSDIIVQTPSKKLNPPMQGSECLALNQAIKYFYNAGVYGITIPKDDILDFRDLNRTKRQQLTFDELDTSKTFFNTVKKTSINNIKTEQKINYMNDTSLYNLCVRLTNAGNNTLSSKASIAQKARERIKYLKSKNIGNVATLNSADTKCAAYDFKATRFEKSKINYSEPSQTGGNPNDSILAQIAELTIRLTDVNSDIVTKTSQLNNMPNPPSTCFTPLCIIQRTARKPLEISLANLISEKTDLEESIAFLRSQLI